MSNSRERRRDEANHTSQAAQACMPNSRERLRKEVRDTSQAAHVFMPNSRERRRDEVRDTSQGADAVMILGIVVAGIASLGGLGIQAATLVLARATLQLAISTAYYGAAGVAVAGTGYAAAQGTIFAAQQTRQGYLATARAAHRASEQIRGRAMAVNRAAMQAAMQAQSTVGNRAAEVSNAASEVANRAANAVHSVMVNAGSLVNRAQEPIPIRIVTAEEALTRADGDDGQEYYLELVLDGAIVWLRISGREDLPAVMAGAIGDAFLGNDSAPQQMAEDRPAGESPKSSEDAGGEAGDASQEDRVKIGGGSILDRRHATPSLGVDSSRATGTSSFTAETVPQDESGSQPADEDMNTDNSIALSNHIAEKDGRESEEDGFELLRPDAEDQDIDPATPSCEAQASRTFRSSSNTDLEGDSREGQTVDDLPSDQILGQPEDAIENGGEASDEDGFEVVEGGSLGHHNLTPYGEEGDFSAATRTSSSTAEAGSKDQQKGEDTPTTENLGLSEDTGEKDRDTSDDVGESSLDLPTSCGEDEHSGTSRTPSSTTEKDREDDLSWDFASSDDEENVQAPHEWVLVATAGNPHPASSTSGADSY